MVIGLMLWLWMTVGASTTIIFYDEPQQVLGGVTYARASCDNGKTTISITPPVAVWILTHELAHALDCQDNWVLDGSPGLLRPSERPVGMTDYCWANDAEYFACAVVRLHPWWKVVRVTDPTRGAAEQP